MKPKQLLILLCFLSLLNGTSAQEYDENRLSYPERQSLIRTLQKQRNRHRKENTNIFYGKVNQLMEKRTKFLTNLVKHNLLITPGEAFKQVQYLFDSLKTSDLVKRKESLLLIMRSPFPNAFCAYEGTIGVTTGLLEAMETEEQIMWVLSHELAHYELDHGNQHIHAYASSYKALSKRQKQELFDPEKSISLETLNTYKEMALGLGKYNRIDEFKADSLGHLIFKELSLPQGVAIHTLNTLDSAFKQPLTFHIDQLFHFRDYPFQPFWFKDRPSYFSSTNARSIFQNDSAKTHPEMAARIARLTSDFEIVVPDLDSMILKERDTSYELENLFSAYSSKNYDYLLFMAAKYYHRKEYRNWIVRLVAAALFELYEHKGEPDFVYLVSPFTFEYGKHLTEINNFLHNTRAGDLLTIGFLFLNRGGHFDPKDESLFLLMWKYAQAMNDAQLMNDIRQSYKQHHPEPKYLKDMR